MATSITIWRRLITTEWEQSARLERGDVEQWDADDPLRPLALHALDTGEGVALVLNPEVTSGLYGDFGWKGREVMETRIDLADIDVEED